MFSDGLPLKPGGIPKPRLGPSSALRRGAATPSKKSHKKKKRPNKGKPVVAAPGQAEGAFTMKNAIGSADVAGNATPRMGKECYGRSFEKTRAIENATKRSSDRELKAMFGISDSKSEPESSMMPGDIEDVPNGDRPLHNPRSAAAANFSDRRDEWMRQGQSLKRYHYVPRLVTFMPAIGDCPVELDKSDDKRRTYAVNFQQ
eukprot:3365548-Pyramimonas_sp.AAC.1